jgi:hypothetical protein
MTEPSTIEYPKNWGDHPTLRGSYYRRIEDIRQAAADGGVLKSARLKELAPEMDRSIQALRARAWQLRLLAPAPPRGLARSARRLRPKANPSGTRALWPSRARALERPPGSAPDAPAGHGDGFMRDSSHYRARF